MAGKVYHIDLRTSHDRSLLWKIEHLVETAGLGGVVKRHGLTAVKLHFGERGNTAFVRPILVRPIVDAIRKSGGKPFLTDANTLYVGTRGNAVDHLSTAILNGFDYSVAGAPLIIADGIDGRDEVSVPIHLKRCRTAYIASAIARADALVSVAHFKLHEASGFGGAIKNVGMGGASRRGKMAQHSEVAPEVVSKKCIGCGVCSDQCAHGAISVVDRPSEEPRPSAEILKIASINHKLCVGCAGCIHACRQQALAINWEKDLPRFMERMVEYTVGAIKGKENRCLFINFITQVSPACDCYPFADAPIVPDIGVLASTDPVAIDRASMDLVNAAVPLASSIIKDSPDAPTDKVKAVYPHIDWRHQLAYAQELGLGEESYELITL